VPVLALIGYWLLRRRTLPYANAGEPEAPIAAPQPVVDTERGRMQ
jgi:hypothetical protein